MAEVGLRTGCLFDAPSRPNTEGGLQQAHLHHGLLGLVFLGAAAVLAGLPAAAHAAMRRDGVRLRWVALSYCAVPFLSAVAAAMFGQEKAARLMSTLWMYGTLQFLLVWGAAFASRAVLRLSGRRSR